jgi:hypothetical protein
MTRGSDIDPSTVRATEASTDADASRTADSSSNDPTLFRSLR